MIVESIHQSQMYGKLLYHPHIGVYVLGSDKHVAVTGEIKLLTGNFLVQTLKHESVNSRYCAIIGRNPEEIKKMKLSSFSALKGNYYEMELPVNFKTPSTVSRVIKENIIQNHPDICFLLFHENEPYQELLTNYFQNCPPPKISEIFEMYLVPIRKEYGIKLPSKAHGVLTWKYQSEVQWKEDLHA